jgi:hypothetical protein
MTRTHSMLIVAAGAFVALFARDAAAQSTKAERCANYAHEAARGTPTSTGVARGAARGALVGSIGGEAGRGAGIGAVTGGTRKAVQRNKSYQTYYNECMRS